MEENADIVSEIAYGDNDTIRVDRPRVAQATQPVNNNSTQQSLVQGKFNANKVPEKVQTLIPEGYRTVANDGSYVFNLGTQRSTFFAQHHEDGNPPEKVETHEWPHAARHTTYYGQQNKQSLSQFDANIEPEKVQTLIPEAYRTQANVINRNPVSRTTFYAQENKDNNMVQFDANIEPEKIHTLIPEGYRSLANDGSYQFNLGTQRSTFFAQTGEQISYDEKNGLWRTNMVQTDNDKSDDIAKDNRDPWVYEFSSDAVKDIKYDSSVAAPSLAQISNSTANATQPAAAFAANASANASQPAAALAANASANASQPAAAFAANATNNGTQPAGAFAQQRDIRTTKYVAENIHDFTKNYTSPIPVFPRSENAPVKAEVNGWPLSYAQSQNKELPLKVFAEDFPRSDNAPKEAVVGGNDGYWPFPQHAQIQKLPSDGSLPTVSWDPLNKEFGIPETFPRSA